MKIRKYIAKDFKTAIEQAKSEMGRDAIILHTRQLKKHKLLGFLSPHQVEITVAADDTLKVNSDLVRDREIIPKTLVNRTIQAPVATDHHKAPDEELLREMQLMKEMMEDIKLKMHEVGNIKGLPDYFQGFYEILTHNHINADIAYSIINNVESRLPQHKTEDEVWVRNMFMNVLQEYLAEASPINTSTYQKGRLVFIVGPTGVGKTTTIAKLAANMTFLEKKNVAMITLDTYRVSAAEQLRTFAEIIGIPISVVFNTEDFKDALQIYKDYDLIFVDTAGRSPRNTEQMKELHNYIQLSRPDETILVLSVTTNSSDLINTYWQFAPINIDKLIFTKLDETYSYGQILNTVHEVNKPIAYLTTGQNVPDDIQIMDPLQLASLLLRKDGLV